MMIKTKSKTGRYRLVDNGNGKLLVIDDPQRFVECLKGAWREAHRITNDEHKIAMAFYKEMSKMFGDIAETQVVSLSDEEEEKIRRSSERTIFVDPKVFYGE